MSDFYKFPSNTGSRVPQQTQYLNFGNSASSVSLFPDSVEELPHNFGNEPCLNTTDSNNRYGRFQSGPNSIDNFSQEFDELFMNDSAKGQSDGSYSAFSPNIQTQQMGMGAMRTQNSGSQLNFPQTSMTPQVNQILFDYIY
jgi:hypothetical protein